MRSRTVTWLTRWRLPQWSQLNSGIFFPTNPMRKYATMLDGTNTPAPNWSVISYIQQREPTVKRSGTENKVIRGCTRSRSIHAAWCPDQIQIHWGHSTVIIQINTYIKNKQQRKQTLVVALKDHNKLGDWSDKCWCLGLDLSTSHPATSIRKNSLHLA